MTPTVRLTVWARPGSSAESIAWDPWRNAWQVRVREAAIAGRANRALLVALARWLRVPSERVRWVRAGTSSVKVAEVDGLDSTEVEARLAAAARVSPERTS